MNKKYDIIVVGAGHAGCEAALAAARMGMDTILLTMDLSTVAKMSCNPAIGGLAKGHLVREIDALGGEMGKAIDDTGIQFRMLNKSKGPAVWGPRAQADRLQYSLRMLQALENQKNLEIRQTMVNGLIVKKGRVRGVKIFTGSELLARSVILTAGTFLNGLIHIGLFNYSAGRAGEFPATGLTESLVDYCGFKVGRLKTGTPPRISGNTINFKEMAIQLGDSNPQPFSFRTEKIKQSQIPCYLTYTTEKTHEIIRSGLDRSPLYTGKIIGIGPRYCPSIETKIVRFPEKNSHQLYLEPEGRYTNEYYLNGFSTSLPEDIQYNAVRTITGLEHSEITRLGYAIEYDYFLPSQLYATLETKPVENLYFAGQINGTSGYEEAAAQGIMAGINASLKLKNKDPFILNRSQAYIGVLIDDLVTKEIEEPYRMFTSLAEYRLLLRQDNADLRLMDFGYKFGLINENTYKKFKKKKILISQFLEDVKRIKLNPQQINPLLQKEQTSLISEKESIYQLLKRPEITIQCLKGVINHPLFEDIQDRDFFMKSLREQVEIEVKYEGYLARQHQQIEKFHKMEDKIIPNRFDYSKIHSLSTEARDKLIKIKPRSIGQASRIAGVSPADIAVLLIALRRR